MFAFVTPLKNENDHTLIERDKTIETQSVTLVGTERDCRTNDIQYVSLEEYAEAIYPPFTVNSTWLIKRKICDENYFKFLRTDLKDSNQDLTELIGSKDLVKHQKNASERAYLEFSDSEILPFIKVMLESNDPIEKLCECSEPCEVPISVLALDEGELLSSGDELDKIESDTDSQDTVIEGEAYKRMRTVAIKEKILQANEELFGSVNKENILSSPPVDDQSLSHADSSESSDNDSDEVILSDTSSDEASSMVPFHLISHKLHTIVEENGEDSERHCSESDTVSISSNQSLLGKEPLGNDESDEEAPKVKRTKKRTKRPTSNKDKSLHSHHSSQTESKSCNSQQAEIHDHETKYIMDHLLMHISGDSSHEFESPMIKELESELVRLMLTVSPASLSAGSSCSSTIGSNNGSDYGSDTLESAEESDSPEEKQPVIPAKEDSPEVDASEETLYICVQLMASLKKITDTSETAEGTENNSAKQYITDQIVSLMQTVNTSQNSSPLFFSFHSKFSASDSDVPSDSDSPPNQKSKTPSESGSETTISASISIPSYDDSDGTPTESEISHEMDELYALLESTPQQLTQYLKNDQVAQFEKDNVYPPSLLCQGSSELKNILPISFEERIARYKDAFLSTETEPEDLKLMSTETLINVETPPSENVDANRRISNSLPLNLNSISKTESNNTLPATKSFDAILSSHKQGSDKYISSKTYPPSSAHFKKLNVIHPILVDEDEGKDLSASKHQEKEVLLLATMRNAKEKASSENDLLVRSKTSKVFGTKSAENICELESTFHDTGYYSSGDSFLSLDDSLTQHRSLTSTETILEEEEPSGPVIVKMSLSSGNIPDAVCTSKSSTLPLSLRSKLASNPRTRSSFFSTSGVLRKLTLLKDDSPHGSRIRIRNRSLSAESERGSHVSLSSFGGSITSVYSAAGGGRYGTVTVSGEVLFGLSYNPKTSCFEISVKECRNLAPVDVKRNRSDPYVKVYLLPDRTKNAKRKTKVKKHTLNPAFDEVLKFHLPLSELEARTLWLSVWHSDRFGRNDFLGEVMLPLSTNALRNSGFKWYPLQEKLDPLDSSVTYKGDLILALKFTSPEASSKSSGTLEILVRQARNLMATRSNGTSDPFCKSYLLPDKSKSGKQKTAVIKKSCNPQWNHTFRYEGLALSDLKERCLELTIWDYDKITSNDFLGGVRLCLGGGKHLGKDVDWMDSVGEEQSLWYTMLERPNTWVEGSLLLRPSMQSKRSAV